ncbi:nucleotidyltransferase domain-containing protein [Paenibacillus aurantius]|uniref:Nucleotidyltransferase domain-containing protein n=1 Tax=Paenibacillus aurantius TaxID=2918900 RepID=A0AA96RHA6_9BACL|nr:nucleotidyltransferase domain-containing protein [Paenibacillus aurantius]WNQ13346.1 nucleotidyltransferase domain-containing protein [Paenibacillus aurantius]
MKTTTEKVRCRSLAAAGRFVQHFYPDSRIVILGGSTASGRASASSDLDLVIIDDTQETSHIVYRQWEDFPVDALVLKGTDLPAALRRGIETGNPILQRICAEGWVLRDDGTAGSLIRECAEDLACGPMPYAEEEIALIRYEIHDFLTDLQSGRCREEELFIVHQLTALVSGLLLRGGGHWSGDGKWQYRSLEHGNPEAAAALTSALSAFYENRDKEPLLNFVRSVMEPYGGLELREVTIRGLFREEGGED